MTDWFPAQLRQCSTKSNGPFCSQLCDVQAITLKGYVYFLYFLLHPEAMHTTFQKPSTIGQTYQTNKKRHEPRTRWCQWKFLLFISLWPVVFLPPVPRQDRTEWSWYLELPGWCDFSFKVVNSCLFSKASASLSCRCMLLWGWWPICLLHFN